MYHNIQSNVTCHAVFTIDQRLYNACEAHVKLNNGHADKQLGCEACQMHYENLQVPCRKLLSTTSDTVQRGEVNLQHFHISRWLCVGEQTKE